MKYGRFNVPWRPVGFFLTFFLLAITTWHLRSALPHPDWAAGNVFGHGESSAESVGSNTGPAIDVTKLDRLVVVAHYHENLAWTQEIDIPVKLVDKDNPDNPDNLNSRNMTEPTSYLYYMIKYYESLPDVVAFVHGHGDDQLFNDTVWMVDRYEALPHPENTQTCNTRHKDERGYLIWIGETAPAPPEDMDFVSVSREYMRAFHDLFDFMTLDVGEGGMGMTLPHYITTLCCSAFTVDRDTIRRVPKEMLIRLFNYLEAGTNWRHGNAMEYVWTVLFNQPGWV